MLRLLAHGYHRPAMLRRLDRYIFMEILPPTVLSLVLYVFLLLMNVLFDVAREAVQNQIGLAVVLQLLYYQLPSLLVISLPMSVLLGTLIGIGRLSADTELVAMQAAGIPFRRLAVPTTILGLTATGVCFYFVAWVAPQGAYAHHQVKREVFLSRYMNTDLLVPRVFHANIPGLLLYYDAREPDSGAFRRVFIYEEDQQAFMERITVARRGELSFDPASGRVNLYLENGSTHARRLDAAPDQGYSVMRFASYQESREAPAYIRAFSGGLQRNLREMSVPELAEQVRRARAEVNPVVRSLRLGQARAELHERFALPAAGLVFALLGLPLGVVTRRGGKASGFALRLAIVLVYWVGYTVMRDAAEAGRMDALVALWIPNAAFALLALGLTLTRMRRVPAGRGLGRILGAPAALLVRLRGNRRRSQSRTPVPTPMVVTPSFPQIIDRYVARSFLKVFFFVLLSVYLVYLLVEFRALVQDMVDNNIPLVVVLQYLAFLVPRMTSTTLPVACLVATLVGLGLMAKANEDTAVKASGVSVYRLMQPVLLVTLVICALGFLLQDEILPATNRLAEQLRDRIAGRTPRSQDPRHRWVMSDDGRMFHYRAGDSEGASFQGLSILDLDAGTFALKSRFQAEQARYLDGKWVVRDAWRRDFTVEEPVLEHLPEGAPVDLAVTPALFQSEEKVLLWGIQREPDQMSYRDQRAYIGELERRGYNTTELRVDLARKITFPVIPLFMVVLGFPFSFKVGSHGSLFGIGLAIGLTVIYWAALAVFNALGTATVLPPILAAWAPNIFFGGIGLYLSLHLRT